MRTDLTKINIMLNKLLQNIAIIFICLGYSSTYAATNGSLWGSIDQPVAPIQQIEKQQEQVQQQEQMIANEKTICELLSAQTTLDSDKDNANKIKDALQRAYKAATPDFKMLLVSSDAANNLYAKYRDLYLKTYCVETKK